LDGVGSAETVLGANSSGDVRDFQIGRDPHQIRVSRKQVVKPIYARAVVHPVGLNQDFCHREGGGEGLRISVLKPAEDVIG